MTKSTPRISTAPAARTGATGTSRPPHGTWTPPTQETESLDKFVADIWGALREIYRGQTGMKAQDFDRDVPPWDELDDEARKNKIEFIKRELLDVVDLAGYEIRKKM